jgi:D-3-phosphoglycerate dehydrogenase
VLALDLVGKDLTAERRVLEPSGIEIALATDAPQPRRLQLAQADGLMANRTRIGAELLAQAPACRCIVTYGVGFDHVDLEIARKRGIIVCNVTDYCSDEAADHTLMLMLTVLRGGIRGDTLVRNGGWGLDALGPIHRLRGLAVGLVGYGRIARAVHARIAAFRMRALVFDPFLPANRRDELKGGAAVDTLDALLGSSDVVSLHVPLNATTRNLIDARALKMMKQGAVLIQPRRTGGLLGSPGSPGRWQIGGRGPGRVPRRAARPWRIRPLRSRTHTTYGLLFDRIGRRAEINCSENDEERPSGHTCEEPNSVRRLMR